MNGDFDIVALIPIEVSIKIFSLLDARSLLACSRVSNVWDNITNYMSSEMWCRACVAADILVTSDKYDNAEDWKRFLSSMIQRKDDMKISACFFADYFQLREPVTAIYCHNGRIALAYPNRIEILSLPECDLIQGFPCTFETTYLKFDDSILIAGSRYGAIQSWSVTSGRILRDYSLTREIPTSLDFLTDCDMFVNSFFHSRTFISGIRVCSMSDHDLFERLAFQEQSLIVRVMLAPNADHPITDEHKECFLFCLFKDCIHVVTLTLGPDFISYIISAFHRFDDIPLRPEISLDVIFKSPGELRFDGSMLYIMVPSLPCANRLIWEWNIRTNNGGYIICNNKVISLLGVGQKYLAYEFKTTDNFESIIISHKFTDEINAIINMPRRRLWLCEDFLCLGETSLLDGLNGENDNGIVSASIANDGLSIQFIKFAPRRE